MLQYTIFALTSIFGLCLAYLVYNSYARFSTKLLIFPFVVICSLFLGSLIMDYAGRPIEQYPQTEFLYVHHTLSQDGKWIYLWCDDEETGNRLYMFPYDRDTAKKLAEAGQQDKPVVGTFTFPEGTSRSAQLTVETVLQYDPREYMMKEGSE